MKTDVADYIKNLKAKDQNLEKQINIYLYKQEMKRKNISDVMEALIGVYLKVKKKISLELKLCVHGRFLSQTCGIRGAFEVLKYFGVLSNENLEALFHEIPSRGSSCSITSIQQLLPEYRNIERLCNYEFKNKAYLLQVRTYFSKLFRVRLLFLNLVFILS